MFNNDLLYFSYPLVCVPVFSINPYNYLNVYKLPNTTLNKNYLLNDTYAGNINMFNDYCYNLIINNVILGNISIYNHYKTIYHNTLINNNINKILIKMLVF